jgi:hypothetical protein
MADDPDAARIERDRERRRAAERSRIDRDRAARRGELERLGRTDAGDAPIPTEEGREAAGAPFVAPAGRSTGEAPRADVEPSPRRIGGAIPVAELDGWLSGDPIERFELLAVNRLPTASLGAALRRDPDRRSEAIARLEALMARVKSELDDPLSAGAFLREQVVRWYEQSPGNPEWVARSGADWAGLFADSKVGGRTVPWINLRLASLRDQIGGADGLGGRLRRTILPGRRATGPTARTAAQQIAAEVAQAFLDDLSSHPRAPDEPVPLVRLSELAVRRQVATVNDALALIFNGPETGPFVILHPNRYPNCEEMVLRPPGPGASGAALAYSLQPGRAVRRGVGRGHGGAGGGGPEGTAEGGGSGAEEIDAETLWQAPSVDRETWRRVVAEAKRSRRRLDSPPKEYRSRAAYEALRALVLEDEAFRPAFLAVKWRGRPSGLPLLVALLHKGTLVPEAATDHEYLEAELGELIEGNPEWRPPEPVWSPPGWRILREGSAHDGFRYRAERAA